MKQKAYKYFWIWEKEKESQWLEKMSSQGLELSELGLFRYTFEGGLPDKYHYQSMLLEHWPSSEIGQSHIRRIEDTGAEYLGSVLRWVYFRKKSSLGPTELFFDRDSKLKQIKRDLGLFLVALLIMLPSTLNQLFFLMRDGKPPNALLALLYLGFFCFLSYGFLGLYREKGRLKKEKIL